MFWLLITSSNLYPFLEFLKKFQLLDMVSFYWVWILIFFPLNDIVLGIIKKNKKNKNRHHLVLGF